MIRGTVRSTNPRDPCGIWSLKTLKNGVENGKSLICAAHCLIALKCDMLVRYF